MMYFLNQNYLPGSHKPLLWYRCDHTMSWGGIEDIWLDRQMEGMINWSVAVDVTTKHLLCMIIYKLVNISSRLS